MPPKKPLQTVTVDDLAKQFKVDTLEDFDQQVSEAESSYSYVYKEALGEGMSEEEAEQAAMKAEQAERDEAVTKYMDAITAVADDLYGKHGLTLVPIRPRKGASRPYEYKVVPEKSWEDAAGHIMQTINGVGLFEYSDLRDFLRAGPWTAREAVLSHLGWIADWPAVYEGRKARFMVERRMR